ncbi:TIGR03790 family protein [Methylomarinum vadi]|uniref:TIGR03790 family protein n=1 Tax=Methylomarinum vadi TaxID=438855 RepID=UPI000A0464CE|nr:TIGR03790 family protein [Methylomarinum vadi]
MTSRFPFQSIQSFTNKYRCLPFDLPVLFFLSLSFASFSANAYSNLLKPLPALTANELAIIVNDSDPLSVKITEYYQARRHIPDENIIHVHFTPGYNTLPVTKFNRIKASVDRQTSQHVQAYALTWMQPYRVGCMSITTAFAAGYNESFCARGCKQTRPSPYFNSDSSQPYQDWQWRPTMALAGENLADVKALIDRGVASDYSRPKGTAYLLQTSDKARNTRAIFFPSIDKAFSGLWPVEILHQDTISNRQDVMFYFTGKTHIDNINTNHFLAGAVADHLTSSGGILTGGEQMSSIEWLKAGATGSYGAVVEPCNFVQKFPNPAIMLHYYLRGNSLIEAYWKSVAWPGQGIFIGEPLAKPFAYQ